MFKVALKDPMIVVMYGFNSPYLPT